MFVLSVRTRENFNLWTYCACSIRKTRSSTRTPIWRSVFPFGFTRSLFFNFFPLNFYRYSFFVPLLLVSQRPLRGTFCGISFCSLLFFCELKRNKIFKCHIFLCNECQSKTVPDLVLNSITVEMLWISLLTLSELRDLVGKVVRDFFLYCATFNPVPRVFSDFNMAAGREKTLTHSELKGQLIGAKTKMAASEKSESWKINRNPCLCFCKIVAVT